MFLQVHHLLGTTSRSTSVCTSPFPQCMGARPGALLQITMPALPPLMPTLYGAFLLLSCRDVHSQALRELRRVLVPGGRVSVLDFNNSQQPLIDGLQVWEGGRGQRRGGCGCCWMVA
jgi:hypothetical protein